MTNSKKINILLFLFMAHCFYLTINSQELDIENDIYNQNLYNGTLYKNSILLLPGNDVFFQNKKFKKEKIHFNNEPYTVLLKYDILNDKVVIPYSHNNISYPVNLMPDLIDRFTLGTHNFVKLKKQEILLKFYKKGFFEEAYKDENFTIYIKHIKNPIKDFNAKVIKYKLVETSRMVLKNKGKLYKISKTNDLIKAMPERKKIIKTFFNKKKLTLQTLIVFLKKINTKNNA